MFTGTGSIVSRRARGRSGVGILPRLPQQIPAEDAALDLPEGVDQLLLRGEGLHLSLRRQSPLTGGTAGLQSPVEAGVLCYALGQLCLLYTSGDGHGGAHAQQLDQHRVLGNEAFL